MYFSVMTQKKKGHTHTHTKNPQNPEGLMTILGLKQKKNLKENVSCDLCMSGFVLLLSRCETGSVVLISQDIANHGRLIFA